MKLECLIQKAVDNMQSTAHEFASRVNAPTLTTINGHQSFRYIEKTIYQAIVLKVIRMVSNLSAAQLLLDNGYVNEQAALQRMLDEGHENILFLSFAIIGNDISQLHENYLRAFWQEEFDSPSALKSTQNRPLIPRSKIHAWLARSPYSGMDESTGVAISNTIHKTYSGYIHGASTHILDMYGGNPARFHMSGMCGSPRHGDHAEDLLNYYYRGIVSMAIAAKAFGDDEKFKNIRSFSLLFSTLTGLG